MSFRMAVTKGVHERFMGLALEQACKALALGEIPVGAVLAAGEELLSDGFYQPIATVASHGPRRAHRDPKSGERVGNYRLSDSMLNVTLEPCLMCVGAIVQARVGTLVYSAVEPRFGAIESTLKLEQVRVPHKLTVVARVS